MGGALRHKEPRSQPLKLQPGMAPRPQASTVLSPGQDGEVGKGTAKTEEETVGY